MKIKINFSNGSGPESAQNPRSPWENDSPDPRPDPPGGRGDKNKIKSVLKYSCVDPTPDPDRAPDPGGSGEGRDPNLLRAVGPRGHQKPTLFLLFLFSQEDSVRRWRAELRASSELLRGVSV